MKRRQEKKEKKRKKREKRRLEALAAAAEEPAENSVMETEVRGDGAETLWGAWMFLMPGGMLGGPSAP